MKITAIPRIEEISDELKNIFSLFKKQRGDIRLIVNDETLEEDCILFETRIQEWIVSLNNHIFTVIEEISDLGDKIELLKKLRQLNLNGSELDKLFINTLNSIVDCK